MKTERGNFRMLSKEQRMPETEDSYRMEAKMADPARCPKCKATYLKGRWTWTKAPEDAASHTCPACQRIADGFPAGYVSLRGTFLPQHRTEVLNLVMARAERAKTEHPLQRIMAVEKTPEGTLVTTTDAHLARGIATALHEAFKGELSLSYSKSENLLRATWTR
jgi:NMD protein affecting ribosome stability and mRNA decay